MFFQWKFLVSGFVQPHTRNCKDVFFFFGVQLRRSRRTPSCMTPCLLVTVGPLVMVRNAGRRLPTAFLHTPVRRLGSSAECSTGCSLRVLRQLIVALISRQARSRTVSVFKYVERWASGYKLVQHLLLVALTQDPSQCDKEAVSFRTADDEFR